MDLLKCIQNLGSWRDERKESADPLVRSYSRCIIIALAVPFLTAFYSQYAHIRAVADSPLQRCMNRVNLNLTASYSRQQSLFKWKCSMLDRPWNFFFRDILCFMFYAILLNYVVVLILNKSRNDDLFFFFFFYKNYYIYIYICKSRYIQIYNVTSGKLRFERNDTFMAKSHFTRIVRFRVKWQNMLNTIFSLLSGRSTSFMLNIFLWRISRW